MLGINGDGRIDLTPTYDGDFFPKPLPELHRDAPAKRTMTGVCEFEGLLFSMLIFIRIWSRQNLTS
jgi:hypothetical protein